MHDVHYKLLFTLFTCCLHVAIYIVYMLFTVAEEEEKRRVMSIEEKAKAEEDKEDSHKHKKRRRKDRKHSDDDDKHTKPERKLKDPQSVSSSGDSSMGKKV